MFGLLRRFILVAIAFAATFLAASTANAFIPAGSKWPQSGGLGTPLTLTYSFQNMFDGGIKMTNGQPLPASLIRSSIEEALGLWASAVPIHFVEVPDDGLSYGQSTKYGQIRFRHLFINGPDPAPPADPIAKAQAYFPPGDQWAGDIEFDNGDPWQESGTRAVPDILGAATHEIGHAIGLNHTDVDGANMYWIFHRFQGLGTGQLYPDDLASIQFAYGPGTGSVTSLVPEPTTPALMLIALLSWSSRRRTRESSL